MSIKKLKRLLDKLELNKSVKKGDEAELKLLCQKTSTRKAIMGLGISDLSFFVKQSIQMEKK